MLNISTRIMSESEQRFIHDVAAVFAPVGMPGSAARMLGYLLLKQSPVPLDEIAGDLEMSKASAWNSARLLERNGQARRYSTPGSKRLLFGPSDNFGASLFWQLSLLAAYGSLLQEGASNVATGAAAARLAAMSDFYLSLRQTMVDAIREWNASQSRDRASPARSAATI